MVRAEVAAANDPGGARVSREEFRTVVWLRGEHDVATKGAVAAALAIAAAADADVVVDLTAVRFMDASILGVILGSRRDLADRDRRLTVRGPQGAARRVIEVCGPAGLIEGPVGGLPAEQAGLSALESWVEVPPEGRPGQGLIRPGRMLAGDGSERRLTGNGPQACS